MGLLPCLNKKGRPRYAVIDLWKLLYYDWGNKYKNILLTWIVQGLM